MSRCWGRLNSWTNPYLEWSKTIQMSGNEREGGIKNADFGRTSFMDDALAKFNYSFVTNAVFTLCEFFMVNN